MSKVQEKQASVEEVKIEIDQIIVDTVFGIFEAVTGLNPLDSIFDDYVSRLIENLRTSSFPLAGKDLELREEQKERLRKVVKTLGHETVRNYIANLNMDERAKAVYGLVREKTTAIADAVLSSIGKEINRGAIINCYAVQANSKNEKYDEILLRKSKESGDITIPTNCVLMSTNCVEVIKASCQTEKKPDEKKGAKQKTGKDAVGETSQEAR